MELPQHWYHGGDMSNFMNHKYSGDNGYCVMASWQWKTWREATNFKLNMDKALKLQELVKERINRDGRALVDVQNWLSKDGRKFTEFEYKILQSLVEESENGI